MVSVHPVTAIVFVFSPSSSRLDSECRSCLTTIVCFACFINVYEEAIPALGIGAGCQSFLFNFLSFLRNLIMVVVLRLDFILHLHPF